MAKKPSKKQPKPKNPLRLDPTRTVTIRRAFGAEIARRIRNAAKEVAEQLIIGMVETGRWVFTTSSEKLEQFHNVVKTLVERGIIPKMVTSDGSYWASYIADGYKKGAGRAYVDVLKAGVGRGSLAVPGGTQKEFVKFMVNRPVPVQRVKQLASRTFNELQGISDATAQQLTRTLADGLVQGKHPHQIAKDIVKSVEGVPINRAKTIARTEIIRAHAEGQLDAMQEMGVDEVGVAVEWATAGNPCKLCAELDGVVLTLEESRGLLPRHPNCRCAWLPANVGEKSSAQIKTKKAIQRSFKNSIKAERPKATIKTAFERSKWAGADVDLKSKRPKSPVGNSRNGQQKKGRGALQRVRVRTDYCVS